jgi:hypothetical protein
MRLNHLLAFDLDTAKSRPVVVETGYRIITAPDAAVHFRLAFRSSWTDGIPPIANTAAVQALCGLRLPFFPGLLSQVTVGKQAPSF